MSDNEDSIKSMDELYDRYAELQIPVLKALIHIGLDMETVALIQMRISNSTKFFADTYHHLMLEGKVKDSEKLNNNELATKLHEEQMMREIRNAEKS